MCLRTTAAPFPSHRLLQPPRPLTQHSEPRKPGPSGGGLPGAKHTLRLPLQLPSAPKPTRSASHCIFADAHAGAAAVAMAVQNNIAPRAPTKMPQAFNSITSPAAASRPLPEVMADRRSTPHGPSFGKQGCTSRDATVRHLESLSMCSERTSHAAC